MIRYDTYPLSTSPHDDSRSFARANQLGNFLHRSWVRASTMRNRSSDAPPTHAIQIHGREQDVDREIDQDRARCAGRCGAPCETDETRDFLDVGDAVGEFGEGARDDDLVVVVLECVGEGVAEGGGGGYAEEGTVVCEGGGEAGEGVAEAVVLLGDDVDFGVDQVE